MVAVEGTLRDLPDERFVVVRDGRDVLVHWTLRQLRERGAVLQRFLADPPNEAMVELAERFAADPDDVLVHNPWLLLRDYAWVRYGTQLWDEATTSHFEALGWRQDHPDEPGLEPFTVRFEAARADPRASFDAMVRWLGLDLRLSRQFRSLLTQPPGTTPPLNEQLKVLVIADPAKERELQLPFARMEGRRVVDVLRRMNRPGLRIDVESRIGPSECDMVEILAQVLVVGGLCVAMAAAFGRSIPVMICALILVGLLVFGPDLGREWISRKAPLWGVWESVSTYGVLVRQTTKVQPEAGPALTAFGVAAALGVLCGGLGSMVLEQPVPGIWAPDSHDPYLWYEVKRLRAEGQRVVQALPGQEVASAAEAGCDRQLLLRDGRWQVAVLS